MLRLCGLGIALWLEEQLNRTVPPQRSSVRRKILPLVNNFFCILLPPSCFAAQTHTTPRRESPENYSPRAKSQTCIPAAFMFCTWLLTYNSEYDKVPDIKWKVVLIVSFFFGEVTTNGVPMSMQSEQLDHRLIPPFKRT